MNLNEPIRSLKQISDIANSLFKCVVRDLGSSFHEKGYRGIELVVGKKYNIAFDPNAIKTSGNASERFKAENFVPDKRVIYIKPGISAKELIDRYLSKIKSSLDQKMVIPDKTITSIESLQPQKEPTDQELLNMWDDGQKVAGKDDDWAEEGSGDKSDVDTAYGEDAQSEPTEESGRLEEIYSAVKTIEENQSVLAGDLMKLADIVDKLQAKGKNKK